MVASALPSILFFPYVCHGRKVPDDLLIALNPAGDSSLPYLVRIPLGPAGIVVKTKDTWPRTSSLYCHRAAGWPAGAEIVLRLPVPVARAAVPSNTGSGTTGVRRLCGAAWRLDAYATAPPVQPKPAAIRNWAREAGLDVPDKGRIPVEVRAAWDAAHQT
jgi:hypothetical protein